MKLYGKLTNNPVRILVVSILIIITVLVARIIDHEIGIRMERLKADIMRYIEIELDRKISYESISPSIFMYLEVRDLAVFTSRTGEEELFRIKTLRVMYNLFTLITERDPLACVTEINISNTLFRLSLKDGNLSPDSGLQTDLLEKLASSNYPFKLTGTRVEIAVESAPYTLGLSNLFFELYTDHGKFRVNLTRGKLNISSMDFLVPESDSGAAKSWMQTNIKLSGSIDPLLNDADFFLTLANTSSSYFDLEKLTFHVKLLDGIIEAVKSEDKIPLDLEIVYNLTGKKLDLDFNSVGFSPLTAVTLTGPLEMLNPWLDFTASARGSLTYKADSDSLEYELRSDMKINRNPVLPAGLRITSSLRGNMKEIYFEPLVIHTVKGGIYFHGNVLFAGYFPEGFLNIVGVQLIPGRELSGSLALDRTGAGMSVKGASLTVGDMGLYDLNLAISLEKQSIGFTLAALLDKNDASRKLDITGNLGMAGELSLSLKGACSGIPVSSAYRFITPDEVISASVSDLLSNYLVSFDFAFSMNARETVLVSERFAVKDLLNPANTAVVSFNVTPRDFTGKIVKLEWEKYRARGECGFSFLKDRALSFAASLLVEDVPYELKGTYSPEAGLAVSGSYDFFTSFASRKDKDSVFYARVTRLPLPIRSVKNRLFYATFIMNGLYKKETDWRIVCPKFAIYDFPITRPWSNTLDASFTLSRNELVFTRLTYKDKLSEIAGSGRIDYDASDVRNSQIVLLNEQGSEKYVITLSSVFKELDISLDFENMPIERIGDSVISGSLNGRIAILGSLVNTRTEMSVSLVKGAFNGDRVTFSATAISAKERITFPSVSASYLDHRISGGEGFFDLSNGGFGIRARYASDLFNKDITSTVSFEGGFRQLPGKYELEEILQRDFISTLGFSDIKAGNETYEPWSVLFFKEGTTYKIRGGPEDVLTGTISSLDGAFELQVAEPFPVQAYAHGVINGKIIDSVIDYISMDADVMNILIGEEVTKFKEGVISGTDIAIRGLPNDPDFNGVLYATGVTLGFFLSPALTKPFEAEFEFREKVLSMSPLEVEAEEGIVACDKAAFYIDHWLPSRYELELHTDNEVGLHTVYDFGAVSVDGYAIGTVEAQGNDRLLRVTGNLDVNFTRITLGAGNGNGKKEAAPNGPALELNLELGTRKKVEFYWPSFAFPVITSIAKPNSKLYLAYSSETNYFNLKGVIDILRGEVFYINRNFHIQEGNISFNVIDPEDFDPRVSLRASIREIDTREQDVDIYFIAENTKLSELRQRARFESVPMKTEEEIFALLGGSIEKEFDPLLITSDVLIHFAVFLQFEQAVQKLLNLDLFTIRTQFLRNILASGMEGQSEAPASPDTLGKYLDDTTITFGRFIGDQIFLMGLVHLKEITDPSRITPASGFLGVEPEFEFVLQVPTPLFNMEWSMAPKAEHYQDLFLPDTKISFEWRYAY